MKQLIIGIALMASFSTFALTNNEAEKCASPSQEQQQSLAIAMSKLSILSSDYKNNIHRDGVLTIMKTSSSCEEFTNSMLNYVQRIGDALVHLENTVETLYETEKE
ncbi:MAG: hypothetical protein BM556_15280 [Bacteriovorax sp. MedPE-SWde]|nr:MAG: hypothetical protein BM556_15280 [Bacteriovorax sp. MedPE-SWde]